MNIYLVGGAVRNMALGLPAHDIDFLVEGATVEEFFDQFPDARLVGKDFPVFLVNGNEYAFVRRERSNGNGHASFDIDFDIEVTVKEDLLRRDLTINAIAMCQETGELTMSNQAAYDLTHRVLRHNSSHFTEDPLRVFRIARFTATMQDFTVANKTIELMKKNAQQLVAPINRTSIQRAGTCIKRLPSSQVFRDSFGGRCS